MVAIATTEARADGWIENLFDSCRPCSRIERAGQPFCISPWAQCSDEKRDFGYYVGGGSAKRGEIRCWHEGTWGWDYQPKGARVALRWWHGRHQGGEGQYEPDERNNPLVKPREK